MLSAGSADAVIAPPASRCPGSICVGSAVVGGQNVAYAYTQHLAPNGQLRVRLNGGAYNTAQAISFTLASLPAFASATATANPTNGAYLLPNQNVNTGKTSVERSDGDGCASCIVDNVLAVQYAGLAAGAYSFNLIIIQHGSSAVITGLPFYVDAGAPANTNESIVWAAYPGLDLPCADSYDNDLNFYVDCRDANCNGRPGSVGNPGLLCETTEQTCYDGFDNDGDGQNDCADAGCNGRLGQQAPPAYCQLNEAGALVNGTTPCNDAFDNDADGILDCGDNLSNPAGNPANTCWRQTAYGCPATEICTTGKDDDYDLSYDDNYDYVATTGVNCQDYDCAGNAACPNRENRTVGGADADSQCFDGIDNDLDRATDCADPDCLGVINIDGRTCNTREFDFGQRYNFCANTRDDDGDDVPAGTSIDCSDSDCRQRFGNCGPCPSREDLAYDACSDAKDNDADGAQNCVDADCLAHSIGGGPSYPRLATLGNAAFCSSAENSVLDCGDGADNDLDGLADCADPGCVGLAGPKGQLCQPAGESTAAVCGDGQDNDGDSASDCADPGCNGIGACAYRNPASWSGVACQVVPRYSGWSAFTSVGPSVFARSYLATHINAMDVIRLCGGTVRPDNTCDTSTAQYSSITVIIGDGGDPAKYYPYAAPTCTVTGTNAGQFAKTVTAGRFIQLFQTSQPVNGFDLQVTCSTAGFSPAAAKSYPIGVSVLKEPGAVPEVGDVSFSTTLHENTVPTISELELETGATLRLPFGSTTRVRVVANDPGAGLGTSGICRCELAPGLSSPTGECLVSVTPADLTASQDGSFAPAAKAEDGANNLSSTYATPVAVNVTPALTTPLALIPSKPFFRSGSLIGLNSAAYITAAGGTFPAATCDVLIRTSPDQSASGNIVNGPLRTGTVPAAVGANTVTCSGSLAVPAGLGDGEYFVSVRVTDEDGDALESNRQVMYRCNTVPEPGQPETVCSKADFDGDGAAEGLYTAPAGPGVQYSPTPYACDNCVALSNDQTDENANGLGDACEPNDDYGRCETDREIVCTCDSDAPSCAGPQCPPGPGGSVQRCIDSWGVCTQTGTVCLNNDECLGTSGGHCRSGGAPCAGDADCGGAAGSCWLGAGQCDNDSSIACKTSLDCSAGGICTGPRLDICDNLLYPWLQTRYGNVFSKKKILAIQEPPSGQHNATFCITAKDVIVKFTSQNCIRYQNGSPQAIAPTVDPGARYDRPQQANAYATPLGRLDVPGLLSGKYSNGTVKTVPAANLTAELNSGPLNGQVIRVVGDVTVGAATILNGGAATRGNGTVVVDGGNLTIAGNIVYGSGAPAALAKLASIGWVVLDDAAGTGNKGNIYIDGSVTQLAGAFFAGGSSGVYTVAPPATDSPQPLTVNGLMVARQFQFSRSFRNVSQGSERIIFDGRAVANPPPGLGDTTKALPLYAAQ